MLILLMPWYLSKVIATISQNMAYQQAILHRYAYLLAYRGTFEPYGQPFGESGRFDFYSLFASN